jgi:methionine-rich copper-binding protein CopC
VTSLRAAVLAAAVVLAVGTPIAAHSLLLASTPASNAQLKSSPPYITLRFNNRIERRLSRVRLVDEHGTTASAPTVPADDAGPEALKAAVPPLAPGVWRVEWQVFSTDGHVVSGSYQFRLAP